MKHLSPLIIFTILAFFVSSFSTTVFAQSTAEKNAIKKWIIANKGNITLVSLPEYEAMSPAVKQVLSNNQQTIIYQTEVTLANIEAFQNKNAGSTFIPFKSDKALTEEMEAAVAVQKARTKEQQGLVDKWVENHKGKNIKILSYKDYSSRPATERNYIDNLPHKIIYTGELLKWEDIETYETSKH